MNIVKIFSFTLTSIFFGKDSIVEVYEGGHNHNILLMVFVMPVLNK